MAALDELEPGRPVWCLLVVLLLAALAQRQDLACEQGRWCAALCTWYVAGIAGYAACQAVWRTATPTPR